MPNPVLSFPQLHTTPFFPCFQNLRRHHFLLASKIPTLVNCPDLSVFGTKQLYCMQQCCLASGNFFHLMEKCHEIFNTFLLQKTPPGPHLNRQELFCEIFVFVKIFTKNLCTHTVLVDYADTVSPYSATLPKMLTWSTTMLTPCQCS